MRFSPPIQETWNNYEFDQFKNFDPTHGYVRAKPIGLGYSERLSDFELWIKLSCTYLFWTITSTGII